LEMNCRRKPLAWFIAVALHEDLRTDRGRMIIGILIISVRGATTRPIVHYGS